MPPHRLLALPSAYTYPMASPCPQLSGLQMAILPCNAGDIRWVVYCQEPDLLLTKLRSLNKKERSFLSCCFSLNDAYILLKGSVTKMLHGEEICLHSAGFLSPVLVDTYSPNSHLEPCRGCLSPGGLGFLCRGLSFSDVFLQVLHGDGRASHCQGSLCWKSSEVMSPRHHSLRVCIPCVGTREF